MRNRKGYIARTIFCMSVILALWIPSLVNAQPLLLFEDVTDRLGTDFARESSVLGGSGLCGLAWADYDRDGDLDLFVTNGPQGDVLFLNDGAGFFSLAEDPGVAVPGAFHLAPVAGDLDNDGWEDLVVMNDLLFGNAFTQGEHTVLRNRGDGSFEDVTFPGELPGGPTSSSSVLFDYDRDGDLDLYIVGPGTVGIPESAGMMDEDGNPLTWDARMDSGRLFENLGDFRFQDVSVEAGVFNRSGSCAVAASDWDQDGWQDLVVANCNTITEGPVFGNCLPGLPCPVCTGPDDEGPCRPEGSGGNPLPAPMNFFHNNGDGTFTDLSTDPESGVDQALGYYMSVTPGDYDNDGDIDFFATNVGLGLGNDDFSEHALLRNDGNNKFTSVAGEVGLGIDIAPYFGWGASFFDIENDGDLDLFYVGAFPPSAFGPTGSPGQMFINDGTGQFTEVDWGGDLSFRLTSAVAAADFDHDGFVDLAIGLDDLPPIAGLPPMDERPMLLRNLGLGGESVQVRAVGTVSNRDAVGARFVFDTAIGQQTREIYAGSSFIASESKIVTVGIGETSRVRSVDVYWPSGYRNRFYNVRSGGETLLPEIPCSFDDQGISFAEYLGCTLTSLEELVDDEVIREARAIRLLVQAVRAWNSAH